jgi:mono/diheme cytochrome c family protein
LTEFAAAMWNKAPAMSAAMRARDIDVPQLGSGEMADLVAYLYSVQYFAETGDPEAGRQVLRTKGCLACHALNGGAGTTAPDLGGKTGVGSPAEVVATMWSHSSIMEAAGGAGLDWPKLSPDEMADIAAFLQTTSQE